MIAHEHVSRAAASALEDAFNDGGWDTHPPTLMLLVGTEVADGSLALAALGFPLHGLAFAEKGPMRLQQLGAAMLDGPLKDKADQFAVSLGSNFAGAVFVSEAWWHPDVLPEPGQSLADVIGSKETRLAILVDCAGRVVDCIRVRGCPPTVSVNEFAATGRSEHDVVRMIVSGLRDLVLSIAEKLPADQADPAAIRQLMTEERVE